MLCCYARGYESNYVLLYHMYALALIVHVCVWATTLAMHCGTSGLVNLWWTGERQLLHRSLAQRILMCARSLHKGIWPLGLFGGGFRPTPPVGKRRGEFFLEHRPSVGA